ncbi:hypothetical protein K0M31_004440 [Melipona bicolor]|uniref:Uncharacterized protein n=1 Tax=Melipona bicolor TaxID=60889 RepID=A0AA40FWT5_9HYME|nr:hypothetical protein K0M31_004440 [Melipona bicolor]
MFYIPFVRGVGNSSIASRRAWKDQEQNVCRFTSPELERCLLVLSGRFSDFTSVYGSAEIVCFSLGREARSFRDGARSFCGKNVQRFVKDRREHVFRSVTNLTGYHGLGWRSSSTKRRAPPPPVARRKERQMHARIWIIVIWVSSVEVDVEIASKFGNRESGSEHPRGWAQDCASRCLRTDMLNHFPRESSFSFPAGIL